MALAGGATVSCSGLGKTFDDRPVLHDVALALDEGSILGLIGPSGCGKTTTVRLLIGLLHPTTGSATVWSTPSTRLTASQRGRIGYLPQLPPLFPDLSLWENLSFHASMYGLRLRRRRRLHEMLRWVHLDEHRHKKVREASGGMQRRVALAAAFVHDPVLAFLDEPTAGIDPILRSALWEQFHEMRDQGRTMLVTTQYVGETAYCDYVGVLSDGELLLVDTPENLRRAAFDGEVIDIELSHEVDPADVGSLARIGCARSQPEQLTSRVWRLVVDDADAAIVRVEEAGAQSNLPIVEAREHVVDFDEAFVRIIERHRRGTAHGASTISDDVVARASSEVR